MMREANEVEQAVARTLRDSLEKLQRSSDELHQSVSDLVSACASTRPANSLPSMIRAQTAAASLAASLEVLARFVTAALQPELRSAAEQRVEQSILSRVPATQAQPAPPSLPRPEQEPATQVISEEVMESQPAEAAAETPSETPSKTPDERRASHMVEEGAPIIPAAARSVSEIETEPLISEAVRESQHAETQ
jgi:hypothetical protein